MHDLERFIRGFQRFRRRYFERAPQRYRELCGGQHPGTLLIGCSDSRVDPAMLLGPDPGDIFTVRNVANLVPPYDERAGHQGVSAAIQFAVNQLRVGRIIVLGHARCGGIRALVDQNLDSEGDTDFIGRWVRIAEPARRRVEQDPGFVGEARYGACERAAILVSLRNLETFPWVRRRMAGGELTLHGWYFDLAAGTLQAYSPRADAFLPLVDEAPPAAA